MFGGFTFASEVLLGRIAAFYGFSIPEAENETSLAEFVRARLQGEPKLGDHISFADKKLVIQIWMAAGAPRLASSLSLRSRFCLREHEPPSLAVPSHQVCGCS